MLPPIEGEVRFEDVHFAYREDTAEVLHGISFTVAAGQTVALVGHTGAGKSTIVKLLARFYDPTGGRITDRRPRPARRHHGVAALAARHRAAGGLPVRRHASATTSPSAAPTHRSRTSSRPPRRSAPTSSSRRCRTATRPQIEERGARLSIGQRQLVAFARALLADPRLLILDEATSSVDIPTEARIEQALEALLDRRTSFVVAHRLSTIRRADLIVVLEHGDGDRERAPTSS